MLMGLVGQEWARSLKLRAVAPDEATTRWVEDALTATPERLGRLAEEAWELQFSSYAPALLQRGRDAVAAGSRDIGAIGRALVALDYTGGEGAAAGHFLTGYSLRIHPDAKRSFELARLCYRDAGAPNEHLPATDLDGDAAGAQIRERLSALASVACDTDLLFGKTPTERLSTAWIDLAVVDRACGARLETGLRTYREALDVLHAVISGRAVPEILPSFESAETVELLSVALVAVDSNPTAVVGLARLLDAAHRSAGRPEGELDQLVQVLVRSRSWVTAATVLQDMVDHGDQRTKTLQSLASALFETDRWPEAKALLEAQIGTPPRETDVPLMQDLVMFGFRRRDPSVSHWSSTLAAMGHGLPEAATPPPTTIKAAIDSTPELLARYEDGKLTIDPRIGELGPGAIKPHMIAAMIAGLPGDQSERLSRETRERDPELWEKANRLLPPSHRERTPETVHYDLAEDLFSQGRYREAIEEYKEAVRHKPDFAVAYLYLGDAHYMLGEYHLAVGYFTESIAIEPSPQAYRFLGDAMQRTGRELGLVKHCYEQALALDPNYGGAIVALRQLNDLMGP